MTNINNLFFELLRVAIGTEGALSQVPSPQEWKALYDMAKKQSLVGICFAGLQRLGADADSGFSKLGLTEMQYLTWMGMAAKIQQRNEVMNGYTTKALDYFRAKGFPCTILKGQAIAKLYTSTGSAQVQSLAALRQSGDVDVWLDCSRRELFELSKKEFGEVEGYNGFHIHYPLFEDCEVEAHFTPGHFSSFVSDRKFQKFCELHKPRGKSDSESNLNFASDFDLPFNLVYILQHCYNHLCGHGVGLRQVMDYYFVLLAAKQRVSKVQEVSRAETMKWVKQLGMERFAQAMMWVMKEVFGLEDEYLLCVPDEKLGHFLLDEIMTTGNMGHHDERVKAGTWSSSLGRYRYNLKRTVYLMKICPQEVVWRPWMSLVSYVKIKIQQ